MSIAIVSFKRRAVFWFRMSKFYSCNVKGAAVSGAKVYSACFGFRGSCYHIIDCLEKDIYEAVIFLLYFYPK